MINFLNPIYQEDVQTAIQHTLDMHSLVNSKIMITGVTGTIGAFLADMLLKYNRDNNANIQVVAAGRNLNKINSRFSAWNDVNFTPVYFDLNEKVELDVEVDYIIHAAGNAHPAAFGDKPVETIIGNIDGTYNLLNYGHMHGMKRFVYISSGEVYGQMDVNIEEFEESNCGYLDNTSPRSCYPLSKRTAENLCFSYAMQQGADVVCVRPCHTFGPDFSENDSRANVQFVRKVLAGEDIVLMSPGTQVRSYMYVGDCASAILSVLTSGKSKEVYNIANPSIRISIAELAYIIAKHAKQEVIFAQDNKLDEKYKSPITRQVLSCKKIESLGWKYGFELENSIDHMLQILR